MVQSLNKKVDLVMDSTAFTGVSDYGKVMIGDKVLNFIILVTHVNIFKFHGKKLIVLLYPYYLRESGFQDMQLKLRKMVHILLLLKKRKKYLEPLELCWSREYSSFFKLF